MEASPAAIREAVGRLRREAVGVLKAARSALASAPDDTGALRALLSLCRIVVRVSRFPVLLPLLVTYLPYLPLVFLPLSLLVLAQMGASTFTILPPARSSETEKRLRSKSESSQSPPEGGAEGSGDTGGNGSGSGSGGNGARRNATKTNRSVYSRAYRIVFVSSKVSDLDTSMRESGVLDVLLQTLRAGQGGDGARFSLERCPATVDELVYATGALKNATVEESNAAYLVQQGAVELLADVMRGIKDGLPSKRNGELGAG